MAIMTSLVKCQVNGNTGDCTQVCKLKWTGWLSPINTKCVPTLPHTYSMSFKMRYLVVTHFKFHSFAGVFEETSFYKTYD